jgi:NADH:ubiquinone oxidoreductase subunit D
MLWAANEMKLRRAQATCGKDASEADVKAQYIKLGGLVIDVPETFETQIEEETADVILKPKKKLFSK